VRSRVGARQRPTSGEDGDPFFFLAFVVSTLLFFAFFHACEEKNRDGKVRAVCGSLLVGWGWMDECISVCAWVCMGMHGYAQGMYESISRGNKLKQREESAQITFYFFSGDTNMKEKANQKNRRNNPIPPARTL